jgi:3,4-dihydroxy-2-butanone 4-phosphate synthase
MLEPDGDGALSLDGARAYAEKYGIPMITGDDILQSMGISKDNN